jgi:hypothetical protein
MSVITRWCRHGSVRPCYKREFEVKVTHPLVYLCCSTFFGNNILNNMGVNSHFSNSKDHMRPKEDGPLRGGAGATAGGEGDDSMERVGYIEANEMSSVLRSLLYRMGKRSTVSYTYSLFVLNTPTRTGHPADDDVADRGKEPAFGPGWTATYGYREGFSVNELKTMAADVTLEAEVAKAERREVKAFRESADGTSISNHIKLMKC